MQYSDENIVNLMRQNKRMARELSRLGEVLNIINEGVIVINKDGTLRVANLAAKKIFGLGDIGVDDDSVNILKSIPELVSCSTDRDPETASNSEFEIFYPERRFIRVYSAPFNGDEDLILLVTDITEEKTSTKERIENEKIASVLKLASGIAHELGNPLNSISIQLQLAKRLIAKLPPSSEREKISDSAEICYEEVGRLDDIIRNFLNALRPARPDLREIDPLLPIVETLKVLKTELENLGIEVGIHSVQMLPTIMGDPALLKQMYFNLLKNATEAMDNGGTIAISADFDDSDIKISINDTGCGIDESEIMRIFEPYFTTKTDGHGLGMMIISEIAKAHGASISLKSKKGEGTTVLLAFPRKEKRIRALGS